MFYETEKTRERQVSNTHYLVIECIATKFNPTNILKMIITDSQEENVLVYDANDLSENDFVVSSVKFSEWKFRVYKDKEEIFEENLSKLISHLTSLYASNIIRYAEWRPK
jgi:hypothetical protein